MPNDPKVNNPNQTIEQEAGLPSNWQPVAARPITPGQSNAAPPPGGVGGTPLSDSLSSNMAPYFSGSIPPIMQSGPDLQMTQYNTPGVPSVRLMPVGPSGLAGINAAIKSVITESGIGNVTLTMPTQFNVSESGTNINVTWKPEPCSLILASLAATPGVPSTPYFNVANSYTGTHLGGQTIVFGQSVSGWASTHTYAAGTLIVDPNGNVERVVIGGVSAGSAPTWPTSGIGTLTTDGGVTWSFVKYLISVGDAIVISTDIEQSGLISIITDGSGNTYFSVTGPQTEPTSTTNTDVWMAIAKANIAYGSTLSITLSWGTGQTYGVQITTFSNILAPDQSAVLNTTTGTTWSSGTITTTEATALLSVSFTSNSNANTVAAPFTIVSDDSPSGSGQISQVGFASEPTPGAYSDLWTSVAGSSPVTVSLIAFPVVVVSAASCPTGLPTFRSMVASDEPSTTVNSVINDINVTGSIAAQELTLGWAGTLAAGRLNANVVQSITNDTNVTGTISAQDLTLGWTGLLGLARGGADANLSATGGAHQVLRQSSAGAAVTVSQLAFTDISGAATGAQLPADVAYLDVAQTFTANQEFSGHIGFFSTSPQPQPTVTGSKGGNAALASLLTALAGLGLIIDSSTV